MKDKMTFHEIYMKLTELRERRDVFARLITESLIEEGEVSSYVEHWKSKYKHVNELIEYYSEIEVEFENKYIKG